MSSITLSLPVRVYITRTVGPEAPTALDGKAPNMYNVHESKALETSEKASTVSK